MASTISNEAISESSSTSSMTTSSLVSTLGGKKLEKQWENNLESLQSQIVNILGAVDKDSVDVSVGQTAIRNDQAVVLAWNKNQTLKQGFKLQEKVQEDDDGVLLYLAIRYNRSEKGSSESSESPKLNGEEEEPLIHPTKATVSSIYIPESKANGRELTQDENNNSGANENSSHSTTQSVPYLTEVSPVAIDLTSSRKALPQDSNLGVFPPFISVSDDPSGSEESYVTDYVVNSGSTLLHSVSYSGDPISEENGKKKRKKSVHWRENLEDPPSTRPFQPLSSSSSLESEEINSTRIQRPQSSRRTSEDSRRRRDHVHAQQLAQQQQQHRVSLLRRQLSVENPRPRRSRSLDDISSQGESSCSSSSSSYSGGRMRVRRPCRRRTRSCSPEGDWSMPLGVLTTKSDPSSLRLDSNVVLPQTPNKIRRLRSKHARFSKNIWFVGSTEKSFNSRCSKKFFIDDLDENSNHYYYFRSYPKVAPSSLTLGSISSSSSTSSTNSLLSSPSSSKAASSYKLTKFD